MPLPAGTMICFGLGQLGDTATIAATPSRLSTPGTRLNPISRSNMAPANTPDDAATAAE